MAGIKSGKNILLLPRPYDFMPKDIARFLIENGVSPDKEVTIFERLTMDERATTKALRDLTSDFSDVSVMVIKR